MVNLTFPQHIVAGNLVAVSGIFNALIPQRNFINVE
jgi:hypothetical protein